MINRDIINKLFNDCQWLKKDHRDLLVDTLPIMYYNKSYRQSSYLFSRESISRNREDIKKLLIDFSKDLQTCDGYAIIGLKDIDRCEDPETVEKIIAIGKAAGYIEYIPTGSLNLNLFVFNIDGSLFSNGYGFYQPGSGC